MFEAGTDTTANELRALIMVLSTHPQIQKRAQQELQHHLGDDLPSLDDLDRLPYIRAMVKEILRWRVVAPNGTVHETTADEWINGYRIPKGTALVYCIWAAHMNPETYANPEIFDPTRFMDGDKLKHGEEEMTTGMEAFGRGRRVCPGLHLATRSMFLVLSRLVWTFQFDYAKDPATGKQIPIDIDATDLSGVVKPFKCSIKPRSEERERIARQEWTNVNPEELGPSVA